jgi:hypothetical protein
LNRKCKNTPFLLWETKSQPTGFPCGSFPCWHPACSRQEGQADLSAVLSAIAPGATAEGPAKVECQHANAPPRQVPGREVAGFQLAPCCPSQHESTAITTRELKAGREGRFWGVNVVFRCRGGGTIRLSHHSLPAAARGGHPAQRPVGWRGPILKRATFQA